MPDRVVEQYQDVLQNIEAAIVAVHRRTPELLDYDVEGALEALISDYGAEQRGRTPPERQLTGARGDVYAAVRTICEWRLGRAPLNGRIVGDEERRSAEVIVTCLKRIRKSLRKWSEEGGRQGYLRLIAQYVA
jgi:hypothetical protein